MRQESLLCHLQRGWVKTTDSEHGYRLYPNLLKDAGWRQLTGMNQAWAGDTTYFRVLRNPSAAAKAQFGFSVALGDTKVVEAAPQEDTGAAHAGTVYEFRGTP
jgi:hypothetical protein